MKSSASGTTRQAALGGVIFHPVTRQQLRAAIKRLGISQVEASRRLGVDPSTVRRWLSGARRIPEPVAILLRTWLTERRRRPRGSRP